MVEYYMGIYRKYPGAMCWKADFSVLLLCDRKRRFRCPFTIFFCVFADFTVLVSIQKYIMEQLGIPTAHES